MGFLLFDGTLLKVSLSIGGFYCHRLAACQVDSTFLFEYVFIEREMQTGRTIDKYT